MKNLIISTCCVCLFVLFSAQAVVPGEDSNAKSSEKNKKVTAKCHVTLVDGTEAIIFRLTQPRRLSELAHNMSGKRVSTQKSLERIKVYRSYQCVLEGDEFTSLKAKTLDKKTPR
ncbi:TapY2 family type IVa secretion system protein [Colwellia psychrerythraea]|nr:TapY2 family type IVa secretion system protein [Colwellia psychrerythraea]